jgi:glutamine amidotransferase
MIAIIDYDIGNVGSIKNMLKKAGYDSIITREENEIEEAAKLILPGVGSFDHGMAMLQQFGLIEILNRQVLEKKKTILGICLGMQLLFESSEEGDSPGLGWIKGKVKKFNFKENPEKLKIPHMGWNHVESEVDSPVFKGFEETPRFYFVHSYYVECESENDSLGRSNYGGEFTSAVSCANVLGTQFHPEKSHRFGLQLMKNFGEMD